MSDATDSGIGRTRWRAIGAGIGATYLSVWAVVLAIITAPERSEPDDAAALSLLFLLVGIALVPVALTLVARLSEQPRPGRVALKGFGLAFVGVPVTFVAGDPVTGLVAGIGLGGAYAMARGEHHSRGARWWGVALAVIYSWVLLRVLLVLGLLIIPLLPLGAVGLADVYRERRAARREGRQTGR